MRLLLAILLTLCQHHDSVNGFTASNPTKFASLRSKNSMIPMSTAEQQEQERRQPIVAKTGGRGAVSASQNAYDKNLSLGAPKVRPTGGHHMTRGGVQVTANVSELDFSSSNIPGTSTYAIERMVNLLDEHKGVLLSSSYEFPGRYVRG